MNLGSSRLVTLSEIMDESKNCILCIRYNLFNTSGDVLCEGQHRLILPTGWFGLGVARPNLVQY